MKTKDQIVAEIVFQQSEYERIKKLLEHEDSMTALRRHEYLEIMSRHAARRQALLWVIEGDA